MKKIETCKIICQEKIGKDIFSIKLSCRNIAKEALPGQFVNLYCNDAGRLLPRPISICDVDAKEGIIRLVYRTVGKGTEEFSHYNEGDCLRVMGPLGNGYTPLMYDGIFKEKDNKKSGEENKFACAKDKKTSGECGTYAGVIPDDRRVMLVGGGIGIPPMLFMAKSLFKYGLSRKNIIAVLGYRSKFDNLFLAKDFEEYCDVYIAVEDGSFGTKGNVLDAVGCNHLEADEICACGPFPMLRALAKYSEENNIPCRISLEERMACGIGACLACVCDTVDIDEHSNVKNARICKDGPVFDSREVII